MHTGRVEARTRSPALWRETNRNERVHVRPRARDGPQTNNRGVL